MLHTTPTNKSPFMNKKILYLLIFCSCKLNAQEVAAQETDMDTLSDMESAYSVKDKQAGKVYRMNYKVDVPVVVVGGAATIYAFSIIYTKKPTPEADILKLNKNDIPAFDRWATKYHD